jgi:hypothetical protein
MSRLLVGRCSNCGGAVSHFAWRCPRCYAANLPNTTVTVAALVAVVAVGAVIAFAVLYPRWGQRAPERPQPAPPKAEAPDDFGWIVTAMAECDVLAKRDTDVLRFLILPLTQTRKVMLEWTPQTIAMIGNSIALVSATDAMLGLRNGVLTLYRKEVTFAVKDPKTGAGFKWKPAIGVSELTTRESFEVLKLGFHVPEVSDDIEWGPEINIKKGSCYWTNPVIRPKPAR